MAEPKKRMTSTRSGNRQSHDALSEVLFISCPNCKNPKLRHLVCKNCGFYKGKKIIALKEDKEKREKVKKELKDE